mgnify:CR=1 FL=1
MAVVVTERKLPAGGDADHAARFSPARQAPWRSMTMDAVLVTLRSEFSDLLDLGQFTRVTVRMLVALLLGALIGWDRERRDADQGQPAARAPAV